MATKSTKSVSKKTTKKPIKKIVKKKTINNKKKKDKKPVIEGLNIKLTFFIILVFGVLFMFSTYAWFSTNLNVQIKTFDMIVTRNSGLTISFDAINYDSYVEISADKLVRGLKETYPGNTSQWAANGLVPVSTNGVLTPNDSKFTVFGSSGIRYRNKTQENGFVNIVQENENKIREFNNYIAFDLFFKNETGSPISDNLYLDEGTEITIEENASEEMLGLLNSIRIGFVKIGEATLNTDPTTIQNLTCNNDCVSTIFEPYSTVHTNLSIERAKKFGVTLVDGEAFPTYGCIRGGGPIYIANTVSGSPNLDPTHFKLQETFTEEEFNRPLFTIPNGVTKVRVYLWIEGQDIDSLETDSEGSDIDISIKFIKDTSGYVEY